MRLDGRTALITGSTQGVGQAIAIAFARAGANVVLHGLEMNSGVEAACGYCRSLGVSADLITGDLSLGEDCIESVFNEATTAQPAIDILVNNAGSYIDTPFLEMGYDVFDKTMKLNVYSYFFLTKHFADYWVERGVSGRVLMIGSINGRLAEETHAAYDTSKGAVDMMVKTLCVTLAPHGIRVNGLAPGLFDTPLTSSALAEPSVRRWMEMHTPNGEVPGPEVCGEAAVFLCSDAASHIHGHMLMVDGGMSAWQQPDPPAAN